MMKWSKYIKPYLAFFILGPLCMIVEVIGEVIMPKLLAVVINNANRGELTTGTSLGIMGLMILTALVMMAGGIGGAYYASKASVSFAADLREDLYRRIQQYSFANIDKFSTGSLVTRLTNDVTQVQNFIAMVLRMALRAPGMMIAALVMAILLNPPLSVVFAVSIPTMLAAVGGIIFTGFPRFGRVQKKVDDLNSTVQENVTNVRVVKSFVREDFEIKKFREANGNLKKAGISAAKVMIFMSPVMTLFMNGTIIAVILIGGPMVLDGRMEIGDLSAFLTYVTQILSSLVMVTFLLMFSSRALASAKRIREVMDEKLDLTDEDAKHKDLTVQNGEITFKNVSFRYYKNSEEKVLNNINLNIPAGSTVGIIGSTGCGKTTLVSMIPRMYDCDEGEVLVDGVNVRDYSLYNLREGVSMVLQKNTLFSGTVTENLQWGDENASPEEIKRMAEYAQADKFVSSFKDGYDTLIEQGGANVSGGQKQRLCIARALLKKPKILILDDSTSAVDTATEAQIRKAFSEKEAPIIGESDPYTENLRRATKLIIAQRISSVQDADTIIVMDDGVITGMGTHDQLLRDNTEYREIYESQTGKGA
ncbi:MAG: ABC transporter ATP-binding protein/permease [Lachnospiraceae bacterium]|nr:ABC transporter ATP-binding protein/permease [Lachnospiraceae bacterium]